MYKRLGYGLPVFLFAMVFLNCGEETNLDEKVDEKDACAGVTCSEHGNCVESDGKAKCSCDPGYESNGLSCAASVPSIAGSCFAPLLAGNYCVDWTGPGYTKEGLKRDCSQLKGTYSVGHCTTVGLSGKCKQHQGQYEYIEYWYNFKDPSLLKEWCEAGGTGVWLSL